jgi:hypothetical protein
MKKLLLATALLLAVPVAGHAAVIQAFGTDPTSASGAFNHSLGALNGGFDDQYTFTLDHQMTLTIASVTNVFAQPSDFITGFTGSVVFEGADGVIGGVDDVTVIGPVAATACPVVPDCQGFAGSAVLGAGNYFLDIASTANGSSGYGGNLATFAPSETPLPAAAWLFAGGLGLLGAFVRKRKA